MAFSLQLFLKIDIIEEASTPHCQAYYRKKKKKKNKGIKLKINKEIKKITKIEGKKNEKNE